jgi:transcriptional regulator with XRE-family HTH domain
MSANVGCQSREKRDCADCGNLLQNRVMGRRVTIRDVAAKTGYSAATVSLALRDSPHLPEATRTRVRRVAEELGYRPDPLLAAIAARRWHGHPAETRSTIAVISDADPSGAQMEGWNGLERRRRPPASTISNPGGRIRGE